MDARLAEEKAKVEAKAKAAAEAAASQGSRSQPAAATAHPQPPTRRRRTLADGGIVLRREISTRSSSSSAIGSSAFCPPRCGPPRASCSASSPSSASFPASSRSPRSSSAKGLGRIQNRLGPNRVGPFGLFQPVADGIKSLTKEDIVPLSANAVVHFLAPLVLVVTVFMGFAVLPMGRNMVLVDMDAGLLFFFAMGAATELSVFMAGWSSRNKYSLLGAMRAVAQMISYEVVLLLSASSVVMIAGSLSLPKIVDAQNQYTGIFPHWYIFTPWGLAGFRDVRHRRHGGNQPLALRSA